MIDKERINEPDHDLLGIVERLVDNLQETNTANTEIFKSVNVSLTKITESLPEIKVLSTKVNDLDTETVTNEVRSISMNMKILLAIIGIVVTLGMTIIGLNISKVEHNIVSGVNSKIEKVFDDHIRIIEDKIKILEDAKRNK